MSLRQLESVLAGASGEGTDVEAQLREVAQGIRERVHKADAESLEYVKEAARLLSRVRDTALFAVQFRAFREAIPYIYAHGAYAEALAAANAMRKASVGAGARAELGWAESYIGVVEMGLGNVAQAIEHYKAALRIAREVGDREREVTALINIGSSFCYAGLFTHAVAYAIEAEKIERANLARPLQLMFAYENLSFALHQLGDLAGARRAAARALEIAPPATDVEFAYVRANLEINVVQLAVDLGDIAMAKAHAAECARYAAIAGTAPALLRATLAEALCDVYAGDTDRGLARLRGAYEQSIPLQHIYRADALTAMVRAYERCNRPEEALRAMRELFQLHFEIRAQAVATLSSLGLEQDAADAAGPEGHLHAWKHREARLEAASLDTVRESRSLELLQRLAISATLRDDASGLHGHRVGRLASQLAAEIGWPRERCEMLGKTAQLHDIGKVAVPDRILMSSEALRRSERELMESHTAIGASLLAMGAGPALTMAAEIAQCHHERWDGQGYPRGLSGDAIPAAARLVAVADMFDALTHGRPFAPAVSRDEALAQIRASAGSALDPALAPRFAAMVERLAAANPDLEAFLAADAARMPFAG